MNALVMYDRKTDSLWSQFMGEAVEGPLAGAKLKLLSARLTRWSAWKEEHPHTLALDTGGPVSDHYAEYYADGRSGVLGQSSFDGRLTAKDLVVGIVGQTTQRAYAHRHLTGILVLNDTFEGVDIVLMLDANTGSTGVFSSDLDGMGLTFSQGPGPVEMTDAETGSVWSKLSGVALEGPLKGKQLAPYPKFDSFWFAWTDFYPSTELFERSPGG